MPIQLRYLDSCLEMYVFPLAGSPTSAMTLGVLVVAVCEEDPAAEEEAAEEPWPGVPRARGTARW